MGQAGGRLFSLLWGGGKNKGLGAWELVSVLLILNYVSLSKAYKPSSSSNPTKWK